MMVCSHNGAGLRLLTVWYFLQTQKASKDQSSNWNQKGFDSKPPLCWFGCSSWIVTRTSLIKVKLLTSDTGTFDTLTLIPQCVFYNGNESKILLLGSDLFSFCFMIDGRCTFSSNLTQHLGANLWPDVYTWSVILQKIHSLNLPMLRPSSTLENITFLVKPPSVFLTNCHETIIFPSCPTQVYIFNASHIASSAATLTVRLDFCLPELCFAFFLLPSVFWKCASFL